MLNAAAGGSQLLDALRSWATCRSFLTFPDDILLAKLAVLWVDSGFARFIFSDVFSFFDLIHLCDELQFAKDAYAQFKAHLTAHNPIIVENVNCHPCYRRALWTQEAFEKILAC